MTIEIRMSGEGAEDELRSLYLWLRGEPAIRQNAQMSLVSGTTASVADTGMGSGQAGHVVDAIALIAGHGFAVQSLALAYATWRGTREAKPAVTIERDGIKVLLHDAGPESIRKIVDALGPG